MKKKDDDLFQQDGKYCVTVHFGAEGISRYVVAAETFGMAIKKIVDDMLKDYPDGFDYDSEIRFKRETFDEIK